MDNLLIMDKMTDEIRSEVEAKNELEASGKKAFYTKFPKKLFNDFEEAIAPTSPTEVFINFMTKYLKPKRKKK